MQVPEVSPAYYRFEIAWNGNIRYHIFDDFYDYFFGGHWPGLYQGKQQLQNLILDAGRWHQAKVPATGGDPIQLWDATARIQQGGAGKDVWKITLELQATQQLSPLAEK